MSQISGVQGLLHQELLVMQKSARFQTFGAKPTRSMVHGKKRIPYWIDRRLTGLAELNMMPSSRLDCPLSLKTPNMGNAGLHVLGAGGRAIACGACRGRWFRPGAQRAHSLGDHRRPWRRPRRVGHSVGTSPGAAAGRLRLRSDGSRLGQRSTLALARAVKAAPTPLARCCAHGSSGLRRDLQEPVVPICQT